MTRQKQKKRWLCSMMAACSLLIGGANLMAQEVYSLGDFALPSALYERFLGVLEADATGELPELYDARTEGLVSQAKDQGFCNASYAFASVGALEAHLRLAYGVDPGDLSEQQQISLNREMHGCSGGNAMAARFWEFMGPLSESDCPYTANDRTRCEHDFEFMEDVRITDFHTVPKNTIDFKKSLITLGPSYWRFDVHSDFFDYWSSGMPGDVYVNQTDELKGGHAVLLIGWNDNKQAYLCQNSWGQSGGPNGDGTFWIAYEGHAVNLDFGMANFDIALNEPECGNGICERGERDTCLADCPGIPEPECGNGICEPGERDCAEDCQASITWPDQRGVERQGWQRSRMRGSR